MVIHSATFLDGEIIQEDTQALIEESTFRIPPDAAASKPWLSVAIGVAIFLIALAILLLL